VACKPKSALKPVTLRNLPEEVAAAIVRRAERDGLSLNRTVARVLEEAVAPYARQETRVYHDLDALLGTWSRAEAEAFERALGDQREVDPDLWR
jgi:plasmid stability protein